MKTLLVSMLLSLQLILFPVSAAHASTSAVGYAKAVSSLSMGIVGSTLAAMCPQGLIFPSIALTLASGIGMVAGDLILSKKYTDYQKKKKSELKVSESEMKDSNGDFQKEVIEQRLDMERQELKNIKGREALHYALGVALTAASALALTEQMIPYYGNISVVCNPVSGEVLGLSISQMITMAWQMLASAGGGTSGAGQIFSVLQMALGLMTKVNVKLTSTAVSSRASFAIFTGVNAGLMYWVAADLSSRKKIAEENIEKLEELKKKIKGTEAPDGTVAGVPTAGDYNNDNLNPKSNIKSLPKVAEAKSCLSMSSNSASFGSSSCKSAVKLSSVEFKGGLNIPVLQSVTSSAVRMANDMAAGNWEGAEVAMGELGSQAAKVRDIAEEVQKKYNDNLKAQGKPTIDFKGEIAKQTAVLDAEVNRAMGGSGNSLATAPQASIAPEASKEEVASSTTTVPAAPAMDIPGMDLNGIGGGIEEANVSGEPAKSLDDSLNDYEVAENDIVKDPGVSIFKQVSNRYILNYNRFFNSAKKSLTPVEEPAAKATP